MASPELYPAYGGIQGVIYQKDEISKILLIVGSCATKDYKPRQVRKEAAVVIPFVCRRGAWLSTSYLWNEN